eukprot:scaffold95268_cov15-Tisochrysis_lutea.AAC.1
MRSRGSEGRVVVGSRRIRVVGVGRRGNPGSGTGLVVGGVHGWMGGMERRVDGVGDGVGRVVLGGDEAGWLGECCWEVWVM